MSDGQFELYRQEESLGKKSNTFLDLEVLDNYTGHRRLCSIDKMNYLISEIYSFIIINIKLGLKKMFQK